MKKIKVDYYTKSNIPETAFSKNVGLLFELKKDDIIFIPWTAKLFGFAFLDVDGKKLAVGKFPEKLLFSEMFNNYAKKYFKDKSTKSHSKGEVNL